MDIKIDSRARDDCKLSLKEKSTFVRLSVHNVRHYIYIYVVQPVCARGFHIIEQQKFTGLSSMRSALSESQEGAVNNAMRRARNIQCIAMARR